MFGEFHETRLTSWEDALDRDEARAKIAKEILADIMNRAEALSAYGRAIDLASDDDMHDWLLEGLACAVQSFADDVAEARERIVRHRLIAPMNWGMFCSDHDPDFAINAIEERDREKGVLRARARSKGNATA